MLCESVDLVCSCVFVYGTRSPPEARAKLNSALPVAYWHILYIVVGN